jgi:hypothetical protein
MKNQAEPPSCLRPPIFMIGQDSQGNWVARDQSGTRGGLFVNRAEALRYIRFENGNRPQAFVTVSGIFELDMTRAQDAAPQRQLGVDAKRELRVA